MPRVPMWRRYLRFFGSDVRADVSDEIRFHLEAKARELMERGLSPEEARTAAERHFGDVAEVRAMCERIGEQHTRRLTWRERMGDWWYDIRHAGRGLRRAPWFTFVAALTLAAGISGAASVFSIVEAWVIRAVRFPNPDELLFIRSLDIRRGRETSVSVPDYEDLARSRQLASLAAWTPESFALSIESEPERIGAAVVSTNFFETLGVQPALGRGFIAGEGERGRHRVAVVSHGFWKARLRGDPAAVGSTIPLNGEPYTVVGVLPERFQFTLTGHRNLWVPLAPDDETRARRQARYLQLIGRMKPGVTVAQAADELKATAARLAKEHPDSNGDIGAIVITLGQEVGRHTGDRITLTVFGITLGLLLIACSNVANLMLVRAFARKRHAMVQLSLGASRGRLIRQSLTETIMLFLAAGAAGALGGAWMTKALTSFIPAENRGFLPDYGTATVNWVVLAFVLGVTLVTGILFGLAPAFEASAANIASVLKESGTGVSQSRRARKYRMALVTGQVILATVLLSCTALLVRTFRATWSGPMGFDSSNVLTFKVSLDEKKYSDATRRRLFFESLLESVASDQYGKPALGLVVPFCHEGGLTTFRVEGPAPADPAETRRLPRAPFNVVSPDYFSALKIALLAGRVFDRRDSPDAQLVAVVSDAFVKQYMGGRDPIGQPVTLGRMRNRAATIVGVVASTRQFADDRSDNPHIYVPFAQSPSSDAYIVLRASSDPLSLAPEIRRRVAAVDARQPVYDAKTMDERMDEGFAPFRIVSGMLVWFGFLALFLAAVGVYGVVAYSITQRTREIGIRAALGADSRRLQGLFLRQGAWIVSAGLVPGLAAGFAATVALRRIFAEINMENVVSTLIPVAGLLGVVLLLAIVLPVRKAASVDPVAAIRCE